jgi:hypothetical protein
MKEDIVRRLRDGGLGKGDIANLERRLFLRSGLSFGALTLLSGCDVVTNTGPVDRFLRMISGFNDGVQAALFSPRRLAPTFSESLVPAQFRFNAQYGIDRIPVLNPMTWRLQPSGLVREKQPWSLEELKALPQREDVTRHVCVEGWSMIGKWGGPSLTKPMVVTIDTMLNSTARKMSTSSRGSRIAIQKVKSVAVVKNSMSSERTCRSSQSVLREPLRIWT